MPNDCLTATLDELAKVGIRAPTIARGGKHIQVRWTSPNREPRMMAVACTPSDVREAANTRRDVRRLLRRDGLLNEASRPAAPARQPSRIELLERRLAEVERRLAEDVPSMATPAGVPRSSCYRGHIISLR